MTAQMWFSSAISLVIGPLPRLVCVCVAWMASFLDNLCQNGQHENLVLMKECLCLGQTMHIRSI